VSKINKLIPELEKMEEKKYSPNTEQNKSLGQLIDKPYPKSYQGV
jgi:hypothetical protein